MSYTPILSYPLNTTTLVEDTSGNSTDLTNVGVTSVSDPTVGNVAYFDGSSYLNLESASVPSAMLGTSDRSYSYWVLSADGAIHGNGENSSHNRYRGKIDANILKMDFNTSNASGTITFSDTEWVHIVNTFDGTTKSIKTYINGVLDIDVVKSSVTTNSGDFSIGRDPSRTDITNYTGYVSDFRIYDQVLDSTTVSDMTDSGPLYVEPVFNVTTSSTFMELSWDTADDSTGYRVEYSVSGSSTITVNDSYTSSESTVIYNLTPDATYEVYLYSTSDDVNFTLAVQKTVIMSGDRTENANLSHFIIDGEYDFSALNDTTREILGYHIDDYLVTGNVVNMEVANLEGKRRVKYIARGESSTIEDTDSIILPFDLTGGSSQTATLTLSDTSNVSVIYDERTNEISVGAEVEREFTLE